MHNLSKLIPTIELRIQSDFCLVWEHSQERRWNRRTTMDAGRQTTNFQRKFEEDGDFWRKFERKDGGRCKTRHRHISGILYFGLFGTVCDVRLAELVLVRNSRGVFRVDGVHSKDLFCSKFSISLNFMQVCHIVTKKHQKTEWIIWQVFCTICVRKVLEKHLKGILFIKGDSSQSWISLMSWRWGLDSYSTWRATA